MELRHGPERNRLGLHRAGKYQAAETRDAPQSDGSRGHRVQGAIDQARDQTSNQQHAPADAG